MDTIRVSSRKYALPAIALNTELLFLVLWRMTGGIWQSAFVAALFGVHPLHVESVAWVAERKDVLSALFWILTMGAYLAQAGGEPSCNSSVSRSDRGWPTPWCLMSFTWGRRFGLHRLPENAELRYNLGFSYAKLGQYEQAIPCYRESLRIRPENAEARANLGVAVGEPGKSRW